MSTKRLLVTLFLVFALGIISGYLFGSKNGVRSVKNFTINNDNSEKEIKALLKLDLLKEYTEFILLPSEKIGNSEEYANSMAEKVKNLDDPQITSKFYATGETENKEQKIIDFLNFLSESIKSDFQ